MNKEILMVVDAVSNEKGVDKEIIFEALEAALASATRKKHGEDWDARVAIDRKTGDYETFRRWKVFADDSKELENPRARAAARGCAATSIPRPRLGGYVEQPIESVAFGRIAAQQAKQVIVQKVREAERAQVVDAYRDRVNTLVSGVVKRVDRNGIYVDLGSNAEGFVPRTDMIPREQAKPQDRVKAYLQGGALRAARPAAVSDPHRARVPDRAVQARGARGRPGPDPDPGRGARSGRARQDRGAAATIRASIRSAPASACAARACRRSRTRSPASAWTSFRTIENPAQFVINAMSPAEVHVDRGRRGLAQHGYRGGRGQAVAGDRPRRPEHPSRQPAHRLGAERHDRVGRRGQERDRGAGAGARLS